MYAFLSLIKKFQKNKNGATAIEYGLIAALMSIVILGALQANGISLGTLYNEVLGQVGAAMDEANS